MPSINIRFRAITGKAKFLDIPELELTLRGYAFMQGRKWAQELSEYPPVPAGSTYKRTFRLKRGWLNFGSSVNVTRGASGLNVRLKNDATDKYGTKYASRVQGQDQWALHYAHGWKNVGAVISQRVWREGVQAIYTRFALQYLRR